MPSLTVELNPNTTYKIRLEAVGYETLEFDYTTGTTATTVTKTLSELKAIFNFISFSISPTTVAPGESTTATMGIKNIGTLASAGKVLFYLNGTKLPDQFLPSISPGATITANIKINIPPGTAPKTYTIKAEVYPTGHTLPTDTRTATLIVKGLATGTLSVSTTPTGAFVKVGTETKTSPCTFSLTPGTHTITITKTGYETITDSAYIRADRTVNKSYTLVKKTVKVTFSANVAAKLYVDGDFKGTLS